MTRIQELYETTNSGKNSEAMKQWITRILRLNETKMEQKFRGSELLYMIRIQRFKSVIKHVLE